MFLQYAPMPVLTTPLHDDTALTPVRVYLKRVERPCLGPDVSPQWWYSDKRGLDGDWERAKAVGVCRSRCPHRVLCAAYAFEYPEDMGTWGGYLDRQRFELRERFPHLIGELIMRVKAHINVTDGRGNRMRPGDDREVPERWGRTLVERGYASELDAAGEILERLDRAAPAPRPRRRPTDPPRPKPQAVVPEPDIDEDLVLDLSTLVDEEMGEVPPSDAGDGLPVGDEDQ